MARAPKTHLLQIIVSGAQNYIIQSYYDGSILPDPLPVIVGDRLAFFVQVKLQFGRLTPPYEILFKDPTFFGTASISVPHGGVSEFLQVRTVKGKVSYTLNVGGIGAVFDPEIQSGSDGPAPTPFPAPTSADPTEDGATESAIVTVPREFTVTWDVCANTLSYVEGTTPGNWPLNVNYLDSVTFVATNAKGNATHFQVNFPSNNGRWGSPFSPDGCSLPAIPPSTGLTTGPVCVEDNVDAKPVSFPIVATLNLDGQPQSSPNDPSYAITMNTSLTLFS